MTVIVTKTNAVRLGTWMAQHPDRLASVDRHLARYIHLPPGSLAVIRDDILRVVFGVEPDDARPPEPPEVRP